jgi:WD40 repeat protein/energy-coupling factor transporter ATP-binding protein EcfA2
MIAAAASPQSNPFPGLRPFREDEEHLFFGRENQVDAMVNKLGDTRFLAVIGTSGSGKSSLVNCGLRPALRQGLLARAGTAWRMAQFRPGNDPIGAMARALAQDGVLFREHAAAGLSLAEIIEATLRMSKLGLIDICEQAALGEGVNLLVVVDQFEELFRYQQLEAAAFVNLLLEARERAASRIFVVLTMRSDFLGDCTKFPGLAEAINAGQYLVPRMTRDERRAAIECPVGVGGAEMSPVLLTRLVNDVGDNPDQLSILQHALNRTWARWQREGGTGPLDLVHYEAIGTMAHALDQHAERAYADLSSEKQQRICERLFKALTDKTDPRGVRRPTTLSTLCALVDATAAEVADVIDVFRKPSRSFLMPPAGDVLEPETVIDISHESLMRVWERLIKWADEEAQSARTYRRVADTAELHAAGNANLWRDPELQLALNWRDKNQPNETWASHYHPGFARAMQFLTESSEARDAERAERAQQRQRERDAELEKAEARARNARRMRAAAVVSSVFFVIAAVLAVWAYRTSVIAEANQAEIQLYLKDANNALSSSLVKAAEEDSNGYRKILLALESLPDTQEEIEGPAFSKVQQILSEAVDDLRELKMLGGITGPVLGVAATRAGTRIVTVVDQNTARVWDGGTGAQLSQLEGHTGPVHAVAITPDGGRIVTGSDDNTSRVWDAGSGAELLKLKGHSGAVLAVAVTPDGTRIITGSDDNTARVWDASSGAELLKLEGHGGPVLAVAATPDGTRIITGSADNTARLWAASDGAPQLQFNGHTGAVMAVAATPDGARVLTGSVDKTARMWAGDSARQLRLFYGHADAVVAVMATPDGSRIVTGSSDRTARVWNASTGAEQFQYKGHAGPVVGLAVVQGNDLIITCSNDGARVWNTALLLTGHTDRVLGVAVTPDGTRIVTGSADATARVWNADTGDALRQLKGHSESVQAVAVTPDGTRIVTGSADGTARVWNADTGAELLQLKGHRGSVQAVAVTPDGTRIVTGSAQRTARVWDASTGAELLRFNGHGGDIWSVAVTPDGSRIVTGSADRTARVWDASTGAELLQLKHRGTVFSVAVTPDGSRIVTGSSDNTARVWETSTGAELSELKGHSDSIRSVVVTSDGARIVTGSTDGTARVWDAKTGVELLRSGRSSPILRMTVTPDGTRVVAGLEDTTAQVWPLARFLRSSSRPAANRQAVIEDAKRVVTRCFTIEERKKLRLDPTPPGWCIDLGKDPYHTRYWKAWRAGNAADMVDPSTAETYADFADNALMQGGRVRAALDAAKLSIQFDPTKIWLTMNLAHANMLLGHTEDAHRQYLAHRGDELDLPGGRSWNATVLDDFKKLRDAGRTHKLMTVIEGEFGLPAKADK